MRSRGIEKAFRAFDRDGDGVITMDELEQALTSAGIPADEETIRRMVRAKEAKCHHLLSLYFCALDVFAWHVEVGGAQRARAAVLAT
eukprot:1160995-Pelagomonas_calceolata.AAC.6